MLGLSLSQLHCHKFRHNFQDSINSLFCCGLEIETTTHFILHYPLFQFPRQSLLINNSKIDENIQKKILINLLQKHFLCMMMKHFFIHHMLIFVCNEEFYMNHHQTGINKLLYNIHSSTKNAPPSIHQLYASSLSGFKSYNCFFQLLVSCYVCYLCIFISL